MMPYSLEMIPEWCNLCIPEHQSTGGCWGILYNQVKIEDGPEGHCKNCEYNSERKNDRN